MMTGEHCHGFWEKHCNFPSALPYLPAEPVFGRARANKTTVTISSLSGTSHQNVMAACELSHCGKMNSVIQGSDI